MVSYSIEPTMDVTEQTNSAFHLMSVWISLLPGYTVTNCAKKSGSVSGVSGSWAGFVA